MTKFIYNVVKNGNTSLIPFEFNYNYYSYIFFKNKFDFYLKSCSFNKLANNLRNLMLICQQNLLHIQKLQKQAYDKNVKPHNYVLGEKIWLNSKYFKIKQN